MPFCPKCNREIKKWNPSQIKKELVEKYAGQKGIIIFSTEREKDELIKAGFYRVWKEGRAQRGGWVIEINTLPASRKFFEIVLDRVIIKDEPRLSDSIEMAWREGERKIKIAIVNKAGKTKTLVFSAANRCDECNRELPEPSPLLFSFNHPIAACPKCNGFGHTLIYDEDLIIDRYLSLSDGAVEIWERPAYEWWKEQMLRGAKRAGIDINKPYKDLSKRDREKVFKGTSEFYGINDFFEELQKKRYKIHVRVFLARHRRPSICPSCRGKRLKKEALCYKLSGRDISELCDMPISEIIKFFEDIKLSSYEREIAKEPLRQIGLKLRFLKRVGLDYLSLNRQAKTLSGGEYQRVNLTNQLGSFLTGTLYVLDEPTIGLHPRDTHRIIKIMKELSGYGNTIIIVEHDKETIQSADWIIELGPGGGERGGDIVFEGPKEEFLKTDTLTSRCVRDIEKIELPVRKRVQNLYEDLYRKRLILYGASGNNLKKVDFKFPLNTLITVTGVSGSGKSSLVVDTLYKAIAREIKFTPEQPLPYKSLKGIGNIESVKLIDQKPIGRTPRSNAVTYLKIFDFIRKLFSEQREAKAHGYVPGFFSFNVHGGRCETCKGEGYKRLEMYFFEDMYITCDECRGKRYKSQALEVYYKEKNIADVLNMTVDEAVEFFSDVPSIKEGLSLMKDVGLGYLRLGQPATTFSGGEAQRLKICAELGNPPSPPFGDRFQICPQRGDSLYLR